MNRKLIVTLLRKDIQELEMITEGFMELNEYPKAIIQLARRKTEDIQSYIDQLSEIKSETIAAVIKDSNQPLTFPTQEHVVPPLAESITETTIDTDTTEEILEEIDAALETTSELVEGDEILENTEAAEVAEDDETIELIEDPYNFDVSTQTKSDETRRTVLGEKNILNTPTRNELLSTPENTLSSTLANTKISDIKQAISIGDRFRFQRELFRGNGEDMNKTLTYLNLLATQNEALSFLQSKYGWTSDNETAEDFYQIVRRRFI